MKSTYNNSIKFLLLTPLFLFLAHHFSVFAHEYAHAMTAWMLGYKANILDINYGGNSLSNLLLLSNIDQKVNNDLIYSLGHPIHVALIALAGPAITLLFYFLSFWFMQTKKVRNNEYLLYFSFFVNLWCLGGIYAYVPIRTFSTHGTMVDILDIQQALQISPWWIYIFGGYFVIFLLWQFFTKTLISMYVYLGLSSTFTRVCLMLICTVILFGYCGLAGFVNHGEIAHFVSANSFLAQPIIILMLWPTREWVKKKIQRYRHTNPFSSRLM